MILGADVMQISPVREGVYAISVVMSLLVLAVGAFFIWHIDREHLGDTKER